MLYKELLDDNLLIAKKLIDEINLLWKACDDNELDCDDVSENVKLLEDKGMNALSMYLMVIELDKIHKRTENQMYDVTKIRISKEAEDEYKEYDKKLLSIMNPDWTELKIDKEIGMLYLFSGFVVDDNLEKYQLKVSDGFIKER